MDFFVFKGKLFLVYWSEGGGKFLIWYVSDMLLLLIVRIVFLMIILNDLGLIIWLFFIFVWMIFGGEGIDGKEYMVYIFVIIR